MGMDESAEHRPRLRIGIGAGVVVLVVALASGVLFSAVAPKGESTSLSPPKIASTSPSDGAPASPAPAVIFVHILGQVAKPGLYEFPDGARGVDAVAAAGGFARNADQSGLNLARVLSDGEQIIVPKKGEAPPAAGPGTTPVPGALVNLNSADEAALETLPGIGPALAGRILAWRDTNGRFASIDDLGSVTGIGDKTLDSLRELVTV
jgi:competence protein ComEA